MSPFPSGCKDGELFPWVIVVLRKGNASFSLLILFVLQHDESSRRYDQQLEQKKEKARLDYAPRVEAYRKKKWCSVCRVKVCVSVSLSFSLDHALCLCTCNSLLCWSWDSLGHCLTRLCLRSTWWVICVGRNIVRHSLLLEWLTLWGFLCTRAPSSVLHPCFQFHPFPSSTPASLTFLSASPSLLLSSSLPCHCSLHLALL